MELKINPQDELIISHNGIFLVDAGAGTGKTYTIIKRYRELINNKVKPENILLITFTNNAADQMKQEIITKVSDLVEITDLIDAPVSTFHSFCGKILKTSGKNAPSFIGVDRIIPPNYSILEDDFFEKELFAKFILKYLKNGKKKYAKVIYSLGTNNDYTQILTIIKKLSSLGIMPARKGWYGNSYERLTGNYEKFSELFDNLNAPMEGARGTNQNDLYKIFNSRKLNPFVDFSEEEIFQEKEVNFEIKNSLFHDPERGIFIDFLRDVYMAYIEELLRRNLMNFDFMIMFAYITLLENRSARDREQFEYIMVDEFQDTDEIQMKLIMLLCKPAGGKVNLCVVGDWKQGIYGFRNATIKNIIEFEKNLINYKAELNNYKKNEPEIIQFDVMPVNKISLDRNYRSSQKILDFSRHTLFTKAGNTDSVDDEYIKENFPNPLIAMRKLDDITQIEFYSTDEKENEITLILKKISELVNETGKYKIREYDKATGDVISERPVKYSDICVLSRTRKFGLELQREAIRQGISANYSGGLEIFASTQGILVLNWLKLIVNGNVSSSWIPVLEAEGYNHKEIKYFIKQIDADKLNVNALFNILPDNLLKFLGYISGISDNIIYIIESILSRYGYRDEISNRIVSAVRGWLDSESYSLVEIAYIIENNITNEFNLEINSSENAFLIQTIHGSKGLEYPVVFVSNCNLRSFPSSRGDSSAIYFDEKTGIRFMKIYNDSGKYSAIYNNWRSDLIKGMVKGVDYDEERRLLYVAITRAKQYLYITSFNPSSFFTEFAARSEMTPVTDYDYEIKPVISDTTAVMFNEKFDFAPSKVKRLVSPHDYLNFKIYNRYDDFPGKEFAVKPGHTGVDFGNIVHTIADKITKGLDVAREYDEVEKIYKLIDGLKGAELRSEIDFILPLEDRVVRGTIDLLAVYDDSVVVLDYKTDKNLNNLETYKIQMSFYYKIAGAIYTDKKIQCKLYFIVLDEMTELDNTELENIFKKTISEKEN